MKDFDTAIILAGGRSTRMGFDKERLMLGDKALIDITISKLKKFFKEIIIVNNKRNFYDDKSIIIVQDEIKDIGPLGGIHAGLKVSQSKFNYVIACDMPYINENYIYFMLEKLKENNDIHALVTKLGDWIEPFNSFYSKNIIKAIEEYVNNGNRSIYSLLKNLKTVYIEEEVARKYSPNWKMFDNLNTKEDLNKFYREYLDGEGKNYA